MDYKLLKLEPFKNAKDDLFFWVKHYYVHKFIHVKKDKDKLKDDFDLSALTNKMLSESTNTIEKVSDVVSEASRMGLSVNQPKRAIEAFYRHIEKQSLESIKDIDQSFVEEFISKYNHDKKQTEKEGLYTYIKALFNFIQEYNTIEVTDKPYMFNIGKDIHGKAKPILSSRKEKKLPVFLETKEMVKLDKSILTYPDYKDEFDRAKQILIVRLCMFGFITTSELMKIKDTDFVEVKEDMGVLELEVNGRVVPLPRRKFIQYINAYREFSQCKESEFFFCSQKTQTAINNQTISKIIKQQFDNAKIKKSQATAEVLRNSGAIYLNRQGVSEKKIQVLLGHSNLQTTQKLLKAGTLDRFSVAELFDEFENI